MVQNQGTIRLDILCEKVLNRDLTDELEAAKGYKWNVRVRAESALTAKVHSRNHTFVVGQPADFSPKVDAPSAIDYLLETCFRFDGGFKAQASRRNIEIDQLEVSLKAGLENVYFIWNWKMREDREYKR